MVRLNPPREKTYEQSVGCHVGGVDSTMAAFLLVERGFDVIGITFKNFDLNELTPRMQNAIVVRLNLSITPAKPAACWVFPTT
jgi:adenylyl- and sulfurtransferase ThiI